MRLCKLLRANHVDIADKLLYNKYQPVTELLLPADNYPLLVLNYLEHLETKTKLNRLHQFSPASYLPHILLSLTMNRLAN